MRQMVVVVSGGARGLGLELCRHLLEQGHRVASFARSETEAVKVMGDRWPHSYLFRALDATDYEAVRDLLEEIDERWGGIDALVNNAAVGQDSFLAHTSPERIREMVRINLEAPMLLTRSVVRHILRRGRTGHVINIGSTGASKGYAGLTVYAATKGALESFTRSLAVELEGRIRVNTLAPGFFDSEMSSVLVPEQRATIIRRTPTGELTTPAGIAEMVGLLLTGRLNINGAVIPMDGGATA